MRRNRGVAIALIVAAAVVVLSGCTPTTQLVDGSRVTVASAQPFTSVNVKTSLGNTPANAAIVGAVTSGFVYYDDTPALVRDESFGTIEIVANDPFTVKYTVNEGIVWSDGVPVDGADLLLAWAANSGHRNTEGFSPDRYIDEATGAFTPFPDGVVYFDGASHSGLQYVSALPELGDDGRSITLRYDRYFVDWELSFDLGLPAHVVAAQALTVTAGEDETAAEAAKRLVVDAIQTDDAPRLAAIATAWNSAFTVGGGAPLIGSGPYVIDEVVPNESVTLTANPLYRGERAPHIETVVVRTFADPLAQVTALLNGGVDVIAPTPSPELISALGAASGIRVQSGSSRVFEHLDLQFSNGLHDTFTDPLVREAFLATVPVADIAAAAGGTPRTSLIFAPSEPVAPTEPNAPSEPVAPSRPDLARAARLLEQSGVVSPPVCILFDPSNPRRLAEYEAIAESAATVGFVVSDCSTSDWTGFLGVPRAYDAALFAWDEATDAVSGVEARLLSTSTVSNFSYYANPAVDSALAELAVERDPDQQRAILERIDGMLQADSYGLALYQFPTIAASSERLDGVSPSPLSGLLWNVWEWQPAAKGA